MTTNNRSWLFRKRTALGAVLVGGMILGTYLPDIWKGFGGGSMTGIGVGDPETGSSIESGDTKPTEDIVAAPSKETPREIVRILIDDRKFLLRDGKEDREMTLADLCDLAKQAKGDAEGIRVRIDRRRSSRASAEQALQDALTAAGLTEKEIDLRPTPID